MNHRLRWPGSPGAPSSPQWLLGAQPPSRQPHPPPHFCPPLHLSRLCHLSGFTPSHHLLPTSSTPTRSAFRPLHSHRVTWLQCVYLEKLPWHRSVCKTPHFCLLLSICCVLSALLAWRPDLLNLPAGCHHLLPVGSDLCMQQTAWDGQQPTDMVPRLGQAQWLTRAGM